MSRGKRGRSKKQNQQRDYAHAREDMRREDVRRATSQKKSKGFRLARQNHRHRPNVNPTERDRQNEYSRLRVLYLCEHPSCEVCGKAAWGKLQIHHKRGRDGLNLFAHFMAVCNSCHSEIHKNPIEARLKGFLE